MRKKLSKDYMSIKMMRMKSVCILVLSVFCVNLLASCGGGGGTTAPTSTPAVSSALDISSAKLVINTAPPVSSSSQGEYIATMTGYGGLSTSYWGNKDATGNVIAITQSLTWQGSDSANAVRTIYDTQDLPVYIKYEKTGYVIKIAWEAAQATYTFYDAQGKLINTKVVTKNSNNQFVVNSATAKQLYEISSEFTNKVSPKTVYSLTGGLSMLFNALESGNTNGLTVNGFARQLLKETTGGMTTAGMVGVAAGLFLEAPAIALGGTAVLGGGLVCRILFSDRVQQLAGDITTAQNYIQESITNTFGTVPDTVLETSVRQAPGPIGGTTGTTTGSTAPTPTVPPALQSAYNSCYIGTPPLYTGTYCSSYADTIGAGGTPAAANLAGATAASSNVGNIGMGGTITATGTPRPASTATAPVVVTLQAAFDSCYGGTPVLYTGNYCSAYAYEIFAGGTPAAANLAGATAAGSNVGNIGMGGTITATGIPRTGSTATAPVITTLQAAYDSCYIGTPPLYTNTYCTNYAYAIAHGSTPAYANQVGAATSGSNVGNIGMGGTVTATGTPRSGSSTTGSTSTGSPASSAPCPSGMVRSGMFNLCQTSPTGTGTSIIGTPCDHDSSIGTCGVSVKIVP